MLATLWLRPLRQRPLRAVATVLGVAAGVGSAVATGLASRAAVASMTADVEAVAGAARLEVNRPGGVPLAEMARLAPLADAAEIAPVVELVALADPADPERPRELVRLLGVDVLGARGELLPDAGGDAGERLLAGEGVLLAENAAVRLGVAPGDVLELVVRTRPVSLEVLATFRPESVASAWERVVVLDVARAQELAGRLDRVDRLELVPRAGADVAELAARAEALVSPGTRVGPASLRRAEGERFVRSLTFNLTALAGVSVLVAVVLVATTLATSVVQRRAAIALLRSLGASRAQLAAAVLLEAAAIGLAGGALGVAAGALAARAIAADVHASFASLDEELLLGSVHLAPGWIAAGIALGLASALSAALLPLQEAWRTPPVQHLRDVPEARRGRHLLAAATSVALVALAWLAARLPPWDERPLGALAAAILLLVALIVLAGPALDALARLPARWLGPWLGTPLALAQAALVAARRRAAWAASAVGVAVALALSMTVMVGSFRANVVDWTEETLRAELSVRPLASAGRIPPDAVALVRDAFGAERVDPYHESAASVDGRPIVLGGAAFAVVAREGGVPFLDPPPESGRDSRAVFAEALAEGKAVANEPFARRFGLWRGDRVRLHTAHGTVERELAGVYRDFSGHTGRVVLDLADFRALAGDEGAESLAVFLPEGADVERERARLGAALAEFGPEGSPFALEVLDNAEVRAEVLRVFERTFAVTVALQAIAAVVAGLAIVLVLTALVSERARELAVVRVLGGSRRQLGALVSAQGLFIGAAGALGGLGVGLAVGWLLVTVVNVQSFGWSLRFTLPPSVLWSAAAVLPASLAASAIPAFLTLRLRPQEALREPD